MAFPVTYHRDAVRITASALLQGRRFAQFKATQLMETSGPAMLRKRLSYGYKTSKFLSRGRAIIDPDGFQTYNPNLPTMPSPVHSVRSLDALTDEEYMVCTPVVLGFCRGTKQWGGFAISRLPDVKWNSQAFQELVLEEIAKRLVHSMIKQHSPDDGFDDLVAGKGERIIFLRQLEYYPGLLILTTDRLGSCDEAFESRIHIAIRYPELDTAARRKIWTTFLERAYNLLGQTTDMGRPQRWASQKMTSHASQISRSTADR